MFLSHPARATAALLLALSLGASACGGDDEPETTSDTEAPGDTAAPDDTEEEPTDDGADDGDDDGGAAEIPEEVCDVISADEAGAVLGETVTAEPAPQGGCTYNGEGVDSLFPQIYFEDASQFDISGVGDPISLAGYDGYINDTGAATGVSVFEGVLVVDGILIRVVANSDDIPGATPRVEGLLELAAGKL